MSMKTETQRMSGGPSDHGQLPTGQMQKGSPDVRIYLNPIVCVCMALVNEVFLNKGDGGSMKSVWNKEKN